MIKCKSLNHVGLRVSNTSRSRRIYEDLLGFKVMPRPQFPFPGAWYGIGHNMVHLIEAAPSGKKIDPLGPHLAIEVEDFDAAKAELDRAGIEYIEAVNMSGVNQVPVSQTGRQLWFIDPDGNTIELRTPGSMTQIPE
jgi:catechol 2,3-dioxygenase-like lactoylglutathione lyase family enzyme